MARTLENIRFALYDLKYSWYYRIWFLLSVVCIVTGFAALIIYSQKSEEAKLERDFRLSFEPVNQLNFPRFHFHVPPENSKTVEITGSACSHNGLGVHTAPCESFNNAVPEISQCVAVVAESIVATAGRTAPFGDKRIECFINTTIDPNTKESGMLVWAVERVGTTRGAPGSFLFVAPNFNAWIMLEPVNTFFGGERRAEWESDLLYHSSGAIQGHYKIDTIISSFFIRDVARVDSFNGYRAIGNIGGLAYFLVILHTIVLVGFGACFKNNSKLLGGEVSH